MLRDIEDTRGRVGGEAGALVRLAPVFVSIYPAAYCYRGPLFVGICKTTRCVNSRTRAVSARARILDHSRAVTLAG